MILNKYIFIILLKEGGTITSIVLIFELIGVVFISTAGSLLHFTYAWSKNYKPLAIIAAVNESTWEHLKIAFWPALVYFIFEYILLSHITNNFILAKAACLLIIPILIISAFYSYTALLGRNYLIIDILIFILSILFGQIISFKLLTTDKFPGLTSSLSIFIIIILIIMFSLFTFFPPKVPIFKDPVSGGYGIYK